MSIALLPKRVPLEKRLFDLFIGLIALLILSPVFLVIILFMIILDGFPVFFVQDRPGLLGEIFQNYKFRTMRNLKNKKGEQVSEEKRLFPLGRFLRRTSLDELPELINVLRGEMSLVGPRPLLVEYLPRYSKEQARRHEVLPGITGWAQINGRNTLSWEERFQLDVWYVDHRSFWLDLKIIFKTIWKVIRGEGISPVNGEIMEKFMGGQKPKR
jgi:sugar transferase EpsL